MKMKKIAFILLSGLMLSGCHVAEQLKKQVVPPTFSAQDLLGERWFCKNSYGMWGGLTEEYYEYKPDGSVISYGTLTVKKDGAEFKYKIQGQATYALNGWYLVEHLNVGSAQRNFDAKAKKLLGSNKKVKEWEHQVFTNLLNTIEQAKVQPATREIEVLNKNALTTKYATSYVICAR